MYRIVLISLAAVFAVALALSGLGILPYTPAEILSTVAVAIGVVLLSGWGLARAFRAAWQWESSVITGFLLFFVLWPTADPQQLWVIACVGAIASASKYLIVWKGRHLLNPAAAALVIASATGLTGAVWWVANSAMFPIVLLASCAILLRTGRVLMGATYVVVASAGASIIMLVHGTTLDSAIVTALLSYPAVFIAGFMLSEPLTLAPRRWQTIALAVFGGVFVSVPFQLGPFFNSPELMLVVVNLLAAIAARRAGIRLTLANRRMLTPTVVEYEFASKYPVPFRAGQYLELAIPHRSADARGTRRALSLSSAPSDSGRVTVAMSVPDRASSAKKALGLAPEGTVFAATGVWGDFVLPRDESIPILMVAGGIGITPFMSQLAEDRTRDIRRDIVLVYVARGAEQYAYGEELEKFAREGQVRVILGGPERPAVLPAGWDYVGPERVTHALLDDQVAGLSQREVFISGPPRMVSELREGLKGSHRGRMHTDEFVGY